ncbi:PhzF family phenazine biosynthesis protein [Paenibacillus aurantiacus]|uniref:PhzF family phenazine biosynthesis protein n=1 Tax=Paenibacillus aurantiacus TaxID=1936118 RepID=A0ABV5KSQ8_9BACL
MAIPIALIDAFASAPFEGNQAAVCLLEEKKPEEWMRKVAAELNVSETAFLVKAEEGYHLRWFTPTAEAELSSEATLAAAHFLYERGLLQPQATARFHTRSGPLLARKRESGIQLDFPAEPARQAEAPEELIQGLGLIPRFVGHNRLGYLVEVDSETTVRDLKPDLSLIRGLPALMVMVTSRGRDYDFVSRVFVPANSMKEDSVTGTAHCALAPYWQRRLRKDEMLAYQASSRGGQLRLSLDQQRVRMTGDAVTVMTGWFHG